MAAGERPENPKISPQAKRANRREGYGPNNPEPMQYHLAGDREQEAPPDALQAAVEYIEHRQ